MGDPARNISPCGMALSGDKSRHIIKCHNPAGICSLIFIGGHPDIQIARTPFSFQVDLIISDDGLQHYALARDLEIVMYDADSAFGNGLCLPAGPLREPLARLSSVDFVLARGSDDPVSGVTYRQDKLVNLASEEERAVSTDSIGSSVFAVAGLARPALFLAALGQLGFEVQARLYPDHHPYSAADFSGLQKKPIIMTEKDAVKCRGLVGADAWYLQVSAILPQAVVQAVVALAGR